MNAIEMQSLVQFQNWPTSVYILLLTVVVSAVAGIAWRPSLPKTAPKLLRDGYPVLGALRFFSSRAEFYNDCLRATKSGHFSFFLGRHPIVGVSGVEGRKTFFESRELHLAEGYAVLLTSSPRVENSSMGQPGEAFGFSKWFTRTMTAMMKKENFVRNLPLLAGDTCARLEAVVSRNGGAREGVLDPFDVIYRIVYQLTMRTVGATEIAESPELLATTLHLFEQIEQSSSPARIIFALLPTPAHLKRMAAGARLYMILDKIAKERKRTGRREEDPLQYLLDTGEDTFNVLAFILGALFAGQLNNGINSAFLFAYLAADPHWYAVVQKEVDNAVARFRTSPSQTPADVLAGLTLEDWESSFPMIDLCLRECIRFQLVGTAFRKNISGKPVPIGKSGEVVPAGAFAVYLLDEIHFDPEVYTNPQKWDPSRYLPDRAEDKKVPLAYLGWGLGRHPCLGMRFAKLEISIIGALFIAMFDYSLEDDKGNRMDAAPTTNRNNHSASKPTVPVRLRYRVRDSWGRGAA